MGKETGFKERHRIYKARRRHILYQIHAKEALLHDLKRYKTSYGKDLNLLDKSGRAQTIYDEEKKKIDLRAQLMAIDHYDKVDREAEKDR
jgi:hypothetical protein